LRLASSKDIKSECLWDHLEKRELKSIILNLPLTYPTSRINGIMISGFPSSSLKKSCYPKNILDELKKEIGEYIIYPEIVHTHSRNEIDEMIPEFLETIEKRKEAAIYLMEKYKYDLFIVQFQLSDTIWHKTNDKNRILRIYNKIDDAIDEILQNIDQNTNVFLISDHGICPTHNKIRLNKLLYKLGLYKTRQSLEKETISKEKLLKKNDETYKKKENINKNLLRKLFIFSGITSEKISYLLSKFHMDFVKKFTRNSKLKRLLPHTSTDWSKTKAFRYSPEMENTGIRINLKGREPNGIVEIEEYKKLMDIIIKNLYELKDPKSGEKIIEKVYKTKEIYSGPHSDKAPDIIFFTKDDNYHMEKDFIGEIVSKSTEYVTHKMNGIFIAKGPDISQNLRIEGARIIDIAPTILHMLNVPIPEDMDGRVLKEIFKEKSSLANIEVEYKKINEKKIIKEKIKKLKTINRI
jgi:predicted AlkP superfamily phosphohydrolase/phosphomutase